jgi:hypothetical protein
MKWIYTLAAIAFAIKMVIIPNTASSISSLEIVESLVRDGGVPNAVSVVIFRNRLYDTIYEVVVFTIAIMGANFLEALLNRKWGNRLSKILAINSYWRNLPIGAKIFRPPEIDVLHFALQFGRINVENYANTLVQTTSDLHLLHIEEGDILPMGTFASDSSGENRV